MEIEKKDAFYLGRLENGKPFFYDSKNLTTHAICLGMTGSGKTGLCIALLEEAGLEKIPAIIIDPKGDLTNLLLTFPHLSPEEFKPWVEEGEAKTVAEAWKEGLSSFHESPERIVRLKDAVDMTIYTPGSNAGVPISILSSFTAPPRDDAEAFSDRVQSVTSGLLGLVGINADPIKSREHILISTILATCWKEGKDLDLVTLIKLVQTPPFDKVGALDLDAFYPAKERLSLAMKLNHLLAAPGFQDWIQGEPLDIQNLLYSKSGKPKFSILSIAHLSPPEQMFFVTLLLNEYLSWMRRQSGSSNLKTLLYMDEIFGFFPPLGNPPSKMPMLRLLKTARAFGVGVVLSTQNPVDLDYKGLSNCGTWFIGKLQTEQDRSRVIDGLNTASNGEFDTKSLGKMLATLAKRTFILRSIYEKEPLIFQTRWTLSYLRGPLTLAQIQKLTGPKPAREEVVTTTQKSVAQAGVTEYYLNGSRNKYEAKILGIAKLHFVDAKSKVDLWQEVCQEAPWDAETKEVLWEKGAPIEINTLDKSPLPGCDYSDFPSSIVQDKKSKNNFANYLYQTQTLALNQFEDLISTPEETEADFRKRAFAALAEKNKAKVTALQEKIGRLEEKIADKKQKTWSKRWSAFLSFLKTILGLFLGRKITQSTISNAETSLGKFGRMGKDDSSEAYQAEIADLKAQIENLNYKAPEELPLQSITIRPRKSDIDIDKIAILWKN